MNGPAPKLPPLMTVEEFLAWPGDGSGRIYELVEGELRAQDAASDPHGTIHAHLVRIIGNHIEAARPNRRVVAAPGLQPNLRATWNYRIPELAVTCASNRAEVHKTPDPLLVVEVLSPSNVRDTWSNIPLCASLPSVMEILVVDSTEVVAHLLRRKADGSWPENPTVIASGAVHLAAIDLALPLTDIYRGT